MHEFKLMFFLVSDWDLARECSRMRIDFDSKKVKKQFARFYSYGFSWHFVHKVNYIDLVEEKEKYRFTLSYFVLGFIYLVLF